MPLEFTERINESTMLAVWRIAEDEVFFKAQLYLSETEEDALNGMLNISRKVQWLSVRMLFGLIKKELALNDSICYDAKGKPYLPCGYYISISHTPQFAAVIVSGKGPTGIDIEKTGERIRKVAHRFLSEGETTWIGHEDCALLTYVWAVKEAVFKLYGIPGLDFKAHMAVEPCKESMPIVVNVRAEGQLCRHGISRKEIDDHILVYINDKVLDL